jgi:hypothetical protein
MLDTIIVHLRLYFQFEDEDDPKSSKKVFQAAKVTRMNLKWILTFNFDYDKYCKYVQ